MPMITADDGCPLNVEVEGRDGAPGADAVELARHQPAHVGRPGGRIRQALPPHPLRPPRPRQIRRAARAPTASSASAATSSRSSTRSRSRRPIGAACRWAAWTGNGSAPTRPTASRSWCSPTPISITPTRAPWADRIKFVREKGLARTGRPQHGALVHQGLPRARAAGHRAHDRDVRRHQSGGLHRLRRGDPRHGFPRLAIRASRRRRWSSSASRIRRRRRPRARRSPARSKAPRLAALDAAHISNIEQPKAFTDAVLNFLQ